MKIIFGAFDNLDIKLLSHKNFCHHLLCMLSQIDLKVKNAKKNQKNSRFMLAIMCVMTSHDEASYEEAIEHLQRVLMLA